MSQTLHLKVVGDQKMTCGGCERSVAATLVQLPGIERVSADHTTQAVDVTLGADSSTLEQIQAELADIGYDVVPA